VFLKDGVAEVEGGRLVGTASADGVVFAFKGVPYAKAPIGELRWRPPQRCAPWAGLRCAQSFAPRCIQPARAANAIGNFGPEPESEDCLYLNLWTAARSAEERRPVMVWFHGGAFYLGSGALPLFDGAQLARQGVVLVTVNYRLGRLGFLAHPDLTTESGTGASGNYGLMDQIAALRWVRDNVAAFGGDPGCVTIFGQSAGSLSVSCHMVSPLAKGLFHRAIGQSAGAFGPVADSSGTGDSMQSLAAAERSGLALARALGAKSIAELRARPARGIQLVRPGGAPDAGEVIDPSRASRGAFDTAYPIIDGHVLPECAYAVFAAGRQNDVPVLTGSTANEGATMPEAPSRAAFTSQARSDFGAMAARFLQLYPANSDAEARAASRTSIGYRNFIWQNWTWARLQAATGRSKAFYYHFSRVSPLPPDADYFENPADKFGAFHGSEIPYVFRTLDVRPWPWQELDRRLSAMMSAYWVNFAAAGDPNGAGLPEWPAFDGQSQRAMLFGDTTTVAPVPMRERLEFWDPYYAGLR
jgi:para-nitrobenzyl esterase